MLPGVNPAVRFFLQNMISRDKHYWRAFSLTNVRLAQRRNRPLPRQSTIMDCGNIRVRKWTQRSDIVHRNRLITLQLFCL